MATGLIALLDDIAALTKLTAASLDDIAAQTVQTSVKAAGVVIDDTAVTPRYVVGLSPARELPIIAQIALGSLRNKLLILLPLCLILSRFAPWAITPLLMLGGLYLCYEGTEKLFEALSPHEEHEHAAEAAKPGDPKEIERKTVNGAIRTDFILSAEIMTLALSGITLPGILLQALVLAAVGVVITVGVYGAVALIVKADDIGLAMARNNTGLLHRIGCGLVHGVPVFLNFLAALGTVAMLWVGGSIILHGLDSLGIGEPEHAVEHAGKVTASALAVFPAAVNWLTMAVLQGLSGILIGSVVLAGLKFGSTAARSFASGR
jgi:predicted DNA repair protein MutK